MVPNQAGSAGNTVDVEEHQRLLAFNGDALVHGIAAILGDAVHTEEPAVLTVVQSQLAALRLERGVADGHIIGDRVNGTGIAHVQVIPLAVLQVGAQQHTAIGHTVHILKQLALAAARGALVHHHHLILIGSDNAGSGGVSSHPALLFADIQQHAVNTLLGGGAGIEVIREHLMAVLQTIVHAHLSAVEVGMAEGGSDIDNGAGLKVVDVLATDKGLELRQSKGKEGRIAGTHQQSLIAILLAARHKGHQDQLLTGQPLIGLDLQLLEVVAVHILKAGLIRGEIIANAHTVRIATAHIVLGEVDGSTVLAAGDHCLLHQLTIDPVADIHLIGIGSVIAKNQAVQHLLRLGNDDTRAVVQYLFQVGREHKLFQQYVHVPQPLFRDIV